ncbi:MAG: hypothetical protein NVSMB65_17910 [Chloroflexota bacterium]
MADGHQQPYVIVVVPCYDEEKRLSVTGFLGCDVPLHRLEFLFVNDGSKDGTLLLLERMRAEAPARVDVLDLGRNRGKAEAVRHGVLRALRKEPDYVGFWDADLATPLSELPLFCELLDGRPPCDMVFGSRVKLLGRAVERKVYRHYFGRVFATAVSLLLRLAVYDTQCGAKVFRATASLQRVFATPFLSRWVFDVEIIARYRDVMAAQGLDVADRIYELPLREWRDVGASKVRPRDAVRAWVDLARIFRLHGRGHARRRAVGAGRRDPEG